jgi:adenylyltransferase/sulfurtransferase
MSTHPALSAQALADIYAHARREYPRECCGIVFGPRATDLADRVHPCVNVQDQLHAEDPAAHPRDARTAYRLDTPELFALDRSLRGDAPARIIYHSHVDAGAYFSETDQAAARMGDEPAYPVEYLVVDVRADGTHGAAQFAWDEVARTYLEVRRY